MNTLLTKTLRKQTKPKLLIKYQVKNLNKSYRPTYYNLRLYFSNFRRYEHGYSKWDTVYGPDGFEKVYIHHQPYLITSGTH